MKVLTEATALEIAIGCVMASSLSLDFKNEVAEVLKGIEKAVCTAPTETDGNENIPSSK